MASLSSHGCPYCTARSSHGILAFVSVDCPVCLASSESPSVCLPCGHLLCRNCFTSMRGDVKSTSRDGRVGLEQRGLSLRATLSLLLLAEVLMHSIVVPYARTHINPNSLQTTSSMSPSLEISDKVDEALTVGSMASGFRVDESVFGLERASPSGFLFSVVKLPITMLTSIVLTLITLYLIVLLPLSVGTLLGWGLWSLLTTIFWACWRLFEVFACLCICIMLSGLQS